MSSCNKIGSDPESTEYVLELDQYDDYTFPFKITTGAGTTEDPEVSMDLTGASLEWTISRTPTTAVLESLIIAYTNRLAGECSASIYVELTCGPTPEDMASRYFHHLVLIDSLGHRRTVAKGLCKVNRGVAPV